MTRKKRVLSDDHKEKICLSLKGNKRALGKRWKLSDETRKKMSLAQKGNTKAKGRINSEEVKSKMSVSAINGKTGKYKRSDKYRSDRSEYFAGNQNPNWKGGVSFLPYAPEFNEKLKRKIKDRDNHTCKNCNTNKGLSIHHIDYRKNNNTDNNLITLCLKCNSLANGNREHWKQYYQKLHHQRVIM